MKRAAVRRLLAGAAGLVVGVGGAFAAAPAQAQPGDGPSGAEFLPACDVVNVLLMTGPTALEWSITVNGEQFWPGEGDAQPAAGEFSNVAVPVEVGDVIEVTYAGAGDDWPIAHTYESSLPCAELPAPVVTQPTCDQPATITIPDWRDLFESPPSASPQPRDPMTPAAAAQPRGPAQAVLLDEVTPLTVKSEESEEEGRPLARLNGDEVEFGSTHEVAPGTHVVGLSGEIFGVELLIKNWTVEVEAPDCPDDDGDGGGAGELPKTGVPTLVVAGVAVLLLAAGAGLFLVTRRRRTSFTA